MKKASFIGGVLVLFLGLFLYLPGLVMNKHPVSLSQWEQVQVGMDREKVLEIIGSPDSIGTNEWRYSRPYLWVSQSVYFNSKGVVSSVEVDL